MTLRRRVLVKALLSAGLALSMTGLHAADDLLSVARDAIGNDAQFQSARAQRLASGEKLLAHVPSHHDHQIGEWIGIRPEVDHVVTFPRDGD